jgi:hypothetical protein
MMQKPSGLLILLLIAAIMLMPLDVPANRAESPLIVSGDSLTQSETVEDAEDDTTQIIAVVVVVIIVIFIIYCITGTDNQSQEWR